MGKKEGNAPGPSDDVARIFVRDEALRGFAGMPCVTHGASTFITTTRTDGLPPRPTVICAGLEEAAAITPDHPMFLMFAPPEYGYLLFCGRAHYTRLPRERLRKIAEMPNVSQSAAMDAGALICLRTAADALMRSSLSEHALLMKFVLRLADPGSSNLERLFATDFGTTQAELLDNAFQSFSPEEKEALTGSIEERVSQQTSVKGVDFEFLIWIGVVLSFICYMFYLRT